MVSRHGFFRVPKQVLEKSPSTLSIVAADAADNIAIQSLTITRSEVTLTIDPVSPQERIKPSITVTGTIDTPGYAVWINGTRAEITGNRWKAVGVRAPRKPRFALEAQPIPLSVNGGKGYGVPRRPTYKDAGNPRPAPLKPHN